MANFVQGNAVTRTVFVGGAAGYSFSTLYKNGVVSVVSLGTIVDNGDGTVTVSFDGVDTDTLGDFTWSIKDGVSAIFWFWDDQVIPATMATAPNDGTFVWNLQQVNLINPTGPALHVESTSGANAAIEIWSALDGVEVKAAQFGLNFVNCQYGIQFISCLRGIMFDTCVDGIFMNGVTNIGILAEGNNAGILASGPSGTGFGATGLLAGLGILCTTGTPPAATICALNIRADGQAIRIRSTNNAGLVITGATAAITLTATSGIAVLYQGVEMALAFALKLLDLADSVDVGFSVRGTLRMLGAAASGKSFLTGATRTYSSQDEAKTRITATTDVSGQRIAVTRDPT